MSRYEARLQEDRELIAADIGALGQAAVTAVENAVRALLENDRSLAAETVAGDLHVNRLSRQLDERCHAFVARHLPSAGHLRFVSSAMRLSLALERIGDYAETISRTVPTLSEKAPTTMREILENVGHHSSRVLRESIDSFLSRDADRARTIHKEAGRSAAGFDRIFDELTAAAKAGKRPVDDMFALLAAFNRLERIIHQSKNIAEDTIFAVTGEMKPEKRLKILFAAAPDKVALATAIARRGFDEAGHFEAISTTESIEVSASAEHDAEQRGLDLGSVVVNPQATMDVRLVEFDFVVDLGGYTPSTPVLPFHTTLLERGLPDEATIDEIKECINDLMTGTFGSKRD